MKTRMGLAGRVLACVMVLGCAAHGDLLNGGFETNGGSGGSADWWVDDGAAGTEGWANHSGDWGMAFVGWSSNYALFHQDNSVLEDFTVSFSLWAAKDVAFEAASINLLLEWYDAGSAFLGSVTNAIYSSMDATWQQFSVAGLAPTNTATVRALVTGTGIGVSGAAAKFDDALLVATIPEPSVLGLIGIALAGLMHMIARRRT